MGPAWLVDRPAVSGMTYYEHISPVHGRHGADTIAAVLEEFG